MADRDYSKRKYRAFVSYSHKDGAIANAVATFIDRLDGGAVWFDRSQLSAASPVGSEIREKMMECRAAVFLVSQNWLQSDWCREEFKQAVGQRPLTHGFFRVIVVKVGDCTFPDWLNVEKYLEFTDLGDDSAEALLSAIYPTIQPGVLDNARPTYFSTGWSAEEVKLSLRLAAQIRQRGLSPIGDAPDQLHYDPERVNRLIGSCGAMVSVLPHRGNGTTSKYVLRELEQGRTAGLPILALVEEGVEWKPPSDVLHLPVNRAQIENPAQLSRIDSAIVSLDEEWKGDGASDYVFVGHAFGRETVDRVQRIKRVVERVSGMPCRIGDRLKGDSLQHEIIALIKSARLAIFDISSDPEDGSNADPVNTYIEAGIAIGLGTKMRLIKGGTRGGRIPFMLRHMEVRPFPTEVDLLVEMHNLGYEIRRSVYL
jgi:hypothetical protein